MTQLEGALSLQMLKVADKNGYRTVLDSMSQINPQQAYRILSDVGIDWLFHCYSMNHRRRCLDLGSGLGHFCFPISGFFDEIVSVERLDNKLKFQNIRARQASVTNIGLIKAETYALPFCDGQFDLIIANDVLWGTSMLNIGNPRSLRLDFLKDIRRCLRPGGCFFVGAENRFQSFSFISRESDQLIRRSCEPAMQEYKSLLEEAGFDSVQFYWTYPRHDYPKFSARLEDEDAYSFLARYHYNKYGDDMNVMKRLSSLIAALAPRFLVGKICRTFWPSVLIFAWKGFKPETIEDHVIRETGSRSLVRMSGGDGANSKISFVALSHGKEQFFCKFPRYFQSHTLEAEESLIKEYAGVDHTRRSIGALTFYCEKPVVGRPYCLSSITDNQRTIDWILQFQDITKVDPITSRDNEDRKIVEATSAFETDMSISDQVEAQTKELRNMLASTDILACSEHGDFCPDNILFSDTGKVIVVDWEFHRRSGNPMLDPCFFVISISSRPSGYSSFCRNLSGDGLYSGIVSNTIRAFCSRRRLPVRAFLLAIPYVLSRCVAKYSVYSDTHSHKVFEYWRLLELWYNKIHTDFSWLKMKEYQTE